MRRQPRLGLERGRGLVRERRWTQGLLGLFTAVLGLSLSPLPGNLLCEVGRGGGVGVTCQAR